MDNFPYNSAARKAHRGWHIRQRDCMPRRWGRGLPAQFGCQTNKVDNRRCGNGRIPKRNRTWALRRPLQHTHGTLHHGTAHDTQHGTAHSTTDDRWIVIARAQWELGHKKRVGTRGQGHQGTGQGGQGAGHPGTP
eukprot:3957994-Pyramimonas_sp.AAC.1